MSTATAQCDQLHCMRKPTMICRKCELRFCGYHAKLGVGAGSTRSYCPRCRGHMRALVDGAPFALATIPRRVMMMTVLPDDRVRLIATTDLMPPGAAKAFCSLLMGFFTGALEEVACSTMDDGQIAAMIQFNAIENHAVLRRHTDWVHSPAEGQSPPSSSPGAA